MKIIREAKPLNPEAIHKSLQTGFGIGHPERIHGYSGLFFDLGDVCASDWVAEQMDQSEEFRAFVFRSLERFENDDYGDISELDRIDNIETKWLSCGWPLFGRYGQMRGGENGGQVLNTVIKIRRLKNVTTVMEESEMDEIPQSD